MFRLVSWYLRFFNLWVFSVAMYFIYLYTYDRFRVSILNISHSAYPAEHAALLLTSSAYTELEPLLATVHLALISTILFSFEEGEGLGYLRYLGGVGRLASYLAKLLAALALFLAPLLAAKLTVILSWEYRALLLSSSYIFLNLASNLALYALYVLPVYGFLALLIRRPAYFLTFALVELYVFERRFRLLNVYRIYAEAAFVYPAGFIYIGGVPAPSPPHALALLFPERLLASLIFAALTLLYYRLWGEVKWR